MTKTDLLAGAPGQLFLTDSGFETTLIFHDGVELPHFASITLMCDRDGRDRVVRYLERHIDIARHTGFGFVIEGPTWRGSSDWGDRLGFEPHTLDALNRDSVLLCRELKAKYETPGMPMVVSGTIGPRGDGYHPGALMPAKAAECYHARQIETLVDAGAEVVTAFTITSALEAIGIARAAKAFGVPAVISFTVETDGRLPTGQALGHAIADVDAATSGSVAYYMINCAHPDHFAGSLEPEQGWTARIGGIRANASRRSHSELDNSTDLDDGNPHELGRQYHDLLGRHPHLKVIGGCCGTDHRHVEAIATAVRGAA